MSCHPFGHIARCCHAKLCTDLRCHDVLLHHLHRSLTDVPLHPVLMEQADLLRNELRDCLACFESVLMRAEAALGKLQVPVVSPLLDLQVASAYGGEACLFGGFSPRSRPRPSSLPVEPTTSGSEVITEVVTPVLQIMPELCGELTLPL